MPAQDQEAFSSFLAEETDAVVDGVIHFRLNGHRLDEDFAAKSACTRGRLARICELTKEVEVSHWATFAGLFTQLDLGEDTKGKFVGTAQELFSDGISWGRIIAMLTFSGYVAHRCETGGLHGLVPCIREWTKNVFQSVLLEWIAEHGGWVSSVMANLACNCDSSLCQ